MSGQAESRDGAPRLLSGGLDSSGMPLGLQFVGRTMSDEHLLAVGAWVQSVIGSAFQAWRL